MSDIILKEGAAPATPDTGKVKFYPKTDGLIYSKDDTGTETLLSGGLGGGGLVTATELTIATGAITKTGNYHSVDTEADASTDDLDTISGGTTNDTLIIFAANDARGIVIKNGTGNILTSGSDDITLDEDHKLIKLVYDGTNWRELGSMAGITASSTDTLTNKSIDGTTNTITNIGFAGFDTDVSDTMSFSSGAYLDSPDVTVTSDGATISVNFEKTGGGDVRVIFNAGVTTIDCTPILSATLTAGSDVSPQINYVYLLQSAPTVLTISTSSFPATSVDHAPVATVFCQSAASLQTDGAYKVHAWTDHMGNGGLGHLAHLNAWIRNQAATWISGVAVTPTITVNGGAEDNVDVATTAGVVRQLHEHAYPVFDTAVSSDVYVVNHNTAAYTIINDLNAADQDDAGNAIGNNDWTNLVLWGVANEVSADCKLFLNLPSGFHSTASSATTDAEGMSNYTMPSEYTGVGFLIARLTLKYSTGSSGTWTLEENLDLRASGAVGGGSGTGGTEFEDNVFRILNVTDPTKEIAFDASSVTTATTRTVTMPDADITLGTDADAIHDNIAAEISALTEKVTPVTGDHIIIEDSADSNNKKRVQVGNLPSSGGAPVSSTYIVQTADGTLTNEQAMGALATGIVKNTTTTGVQSIAVANTDFAAATHAERHLTGTADEIDGDKLDIDYTPSNYTPSTSPAEADSLDNLTAHLAGIDTALTGGGGDVSKVGTPVDSQIGVWTGDGTIEGDAALTFDDATDTLAIAASGDIAFGAVSVLNDAAGTTTLQNIDAIDATTIATFESGLTIDNISGVLSVSEGGTGAITEALARTNLGVDIGVDVQAYDAQLDDIAALTIADGATIRSNATNWIAVKNNLVATVAPTVTDDNTAGYVIGSVWFDLTATRVYDLLDAATGSADWVLRSSPFASTSVKGISEWATDTQVIAGTDAGLVVRPSSLPILHQDNKYTYVAATGAVNTFAITLTPAPATYANGQIFQFKANLAITGAATLAVNGQAAKAIVSAEGVALVADDIKLNSIVVVAYESVNDRFQMLTPIANAASGGGATVTSDESTLNLGADLATASTSFVDADATNLSVTITTTGGDVRVNFHGTIRNNTVGQKVNIELDVDGAANAGDDGILTIGQDAANDGYPTSFTRLISGLSAASHTFKIQWKVSGGTGVLYAGAGTTNYDIHPQFWVEEIS